MNSALIGHTGFVGGNLFAQRPFDATFNSSNFREMAGRHFTEIVCAGLPAVKWQANQAPDEDRRRIRELEEVLESVTADRFVLISTIDVYPLLRDADEGYDCRPVPNHAYGRHRLAFEDFIAARFRNNFVTRLPGLFGPGLKKNVIFDLLHDNRVEAINPDSSFQYYDTRLLWGDIERQLRAGVRLLNIFTEPVRTGAIIERHFADMTVGEKRGDEIHYDLRTKHASLWGKAGGYAYSGDEVMARLDDFIHAERGRRKA